MADVIRASGLVKRFGDVTALDGLDLAVPEGTVLGLLGPNGAGKTTAVRILTTLLRPDEGSAEVAGLDLLTHPEAVRRRIGLSGQYAAVDEYLTGFENLEMVGRLYRLGKSQSRRRAEELLDRFSLADAGNRPVKTYSGGMRRRLDLASALVHEPPVLFLDEPTTGLDPVSRKTIWTEVEQLNHDGTTVFLTTQYLEEADQLADRVGIIDFGKLVAEDTPKVLKAQLGHPHLEIKLSDDGTDRAEEVVARFGKPLPMRDGAVLVELERGAGGVAPVVRALDEAGLNVEALDLVEPSLDDVFLARTGHHLEPEEEEEGAQTQSAEDGESE